MEKLHLNRRRFYIIALLLCLAFFVIGAQKALAVSPPTISPNTGLFSGSQTVTISAPAGTIYITTDGTVPTTSSQVYSSSLTVSNTTTINAIAVQSGVSSSVTTATLTFDPTTLLLGLYPLGGLWFRSDVGVTSNAGLVSSWLNMNTYAANASQTSTSNQPSILLNSLNGHPGIQTGSNKYFNLGTYNDFQVPSFYFITKPNSTTNGALLDLALNSTHADDVNCSVAAPSSTLTIYQGSTPASFTASSTVSAGQYAELQMISSNPSTASIYTNGLLSASGTLAPPPITFHSSNYIGNDFASNFYDGIIYEILMSNSSVYTGFAQPDPYLLSRYQLLTLNPQAPIISVATGTLSGPTQVAISVPPDCVCNYTLDGTTPTSTSPSYQEPINVFYSQTLNAIAFKNGFSSSVSSATYTLDSTQWPAPNPSDTTPLQINVQSPN